MLFVLALLVALLAFWAYVRWDAHRFKNAPAVPLDRHTMERGYKPEGIVKWQVYLGLGCMAGCSPLSSGRLRLILPLPVAGLSRSRLHLSCLEAVGCS